MSAGTPIQVRLQKEELDVLDRYRREQPNPPTRGRALKQLARAALRGLTSSHDESNGAAPQSSAAPELGAAACLIVSSWSAALPTGERR
jgi:hypothetical protein